MKMNKKALLLIGGILVAGATYYYFKNRNLRKRYKDIDATIMPRTSIDSLIANPKLD